MTDGGPFDGHLRSLRSNEDQVLGAGGIALRLGMFYGPEPMTYQMMRSCRHRTLPIPRSAGTAHPIHIDDAAGATVAALESDRTGQAYNIADDRPVGMDEFLDEVARAAGAPRPFRVPGALLRRCPTCTPSWWGRRSVSTAPRLMPNSVGNPVSAPASTDSRR